MDRYLTSAVREDVGRKIILITGPRQVGKTTLAKMLSSDLEYFNYDYPPDRLTLREQSWDRAKELLVFDELHKQPNWKSWLKGIYDVEGMPPAIVVTGSAKLDLLRKMGDSLAGRFLQFRLHPLDLKEIKTFLDFEDIEHQLDKILECGTFPEPFLNGTTRFYRRWQASHLDIILKQDLLDLESVQRLSQMETLVELLKNRVGSPVSYVSLARDLQCSDKTIKRWLQILEDLYVVFKVVPYHTSVVRALRKMPKYYFYDTGQVRGDNGVKLENLVACSLLKEAHYQKDCQGRDISFHYLRDKDGREIDFCVVLDGRPSLLLEVKWNEDRPSGNFKTFRTYFPEARMVQLSRYLKREKTFPDGLEIRRAATWLAGLTID